MTEQPHSTPIKPTTHTTAQPECTTNHKYRDLEKSDLGQDMKDYFVGPMPPGEFLDAFFPPDKLNRDEKIAEWERGVWKETIDKKTETQSYNSFVDVAARFCPSLRVVNSSNNIDSSKRNQFSFAVKPDYCVYLNDVDATVISDMSQVEIVGEAKWDKGDDPFVHPPVTRANGKKSFWNYGSDKTSCDTAGQITSYAAAQLGTQYRTCVYSFFIVKEKARLIRWDRSGAIVTEPFEYNEQPHLAEFFRRYSEASPELRGVDTTVTKPTADEEAEARPFLDEHLGPARPLLNVSVPVEGGQARHYITGVPTAAPHSPPGRSTRGGVAYDIEDKRLVYLKDTWRIDIVTMKKEGEIYEILKEKKVNNIAEYLLSGDILDHVTESDEYAKKPWACWTETLYPHRHYRLVLGTIGRSLTKFSSTYEMVQAVRDAMQAHWEAYIAGILHRDISVGNILIVNGRGLLIDWDFSKMITEGEEVPRRTLRTGTWQFMSAALIEGRTKQHTFIDDLESSLYVILFAAALYTKSSLAPAQLRQLLKEVFDPTPTADGAVETRSQWLHKNSTMDTINFPEAPMLERLINSLALSFKPRYDKQNPSATPVNVVQGLKVYRTDTTPPLSSHVELLDQLDAVLSERSWWPDNDAATLQEIAPSRDQMLHLTKKNIKTGMDHTQSDRPTKKPRTGQRPSAVDEQVDLFSPIPGL